MKVEFTSPLRVQESEPEGTWILLEDLTATIRGDDGAPLDVVVPAGYITDFCSVPAPFEKIANKAGALHDWLYTTANHPREWCDEVLKAAVIACGYSEITAEAFYMAVRVGGASHFFGWKSQPADHRDQVFRVETPIALPPAVDLRPMCPNIYNQGQLGSCTANAIAAAIHFDRMKQKLTPSFIPSRLFIYYNERAMEGTVGIDAGANIRDGIKSVATQGDCPEGAVPGFVGWNYRIQDFAVKPSPACYAQALKYRAVNYAAVPQTEQSLKQCLAQGYPVVFGFTVYDSFETQFVAATGDAPMPEKFDTALGGHAVLLVGYDDATGRWLIRNSWGKGWGKAGYFTLPYAYLTDPNIASDFWTIRIVAA